MKKIFISSIIVLAIVLSVVSVTSEKTAEAASYNQYPTFALASSTVFTLTTTSTRLLSTTTTPRRYGATIQPINATGGCGGAFLSLNKDAAATTNSGLLAFASSTLIMGDYVNQLPVVQGAVQGITGGGTCTVLVTEWRTLY